MVRWLQVLRDSKFFQNLVTAVILFAGVLVGVETYPDLVHEYHTPLHILDKVVLGIFCVEVVVKMGAEGSKPWLYFKDPWNIFDFAVVAASFLPGGGTMIVVLRLVRLLRVLKLVRALPRLQLIVSALLKSIPSMGYVSLLLLLLFYVYGVAAVFLYGANDPVHFGNIPKAFLSLFASATLEGWVDLMYIQMQGCAHYGYDGIEQLCLHSEAQPLSAPLFFVSFVLIGTMIILNLFIGVIMAGMEEAQQEAADDERKRKFDGGIEPLMEDDLAMVLKEITMLQDLVTRIQRRSTREHKFLVKAGAIPPETHRLGPDDPRPAPGELYWGADRETPHGAPSANPEPEAEAAPIAKAEPAAEAAATPAKKTAKKKKSSTSSKSAADDEG